MSVSYDDLIDMANLDIDPMIKETISKSVTKLSVDNQGQAEEACYRMSKSFSKLYWHMSGLANYSNKSMHVYMKFFSLLTGHSEGCLG